MPIDRSRMTDARGRHVPLRSAAPRGQHELVAKLDELASRVRRLAPPSARHPERFHEDRSEIARELQRLSEQLSRR